MKHQVDYIIDNVIIDESNSPKTLIIKDNKFYDIIDINTHHNYISNNYEDAKNCVGIPGLVEAHIHLDKALIADRLPNRSGTLQEALKVTAQLKSTFTYDDIITRAEQALRMLIKKGTTHLRTHAEFDPIGGFDGFRAITELKEKYKQYVDMQIVAFPQEGIIQSPGTEQMMINALEMGADVVGGIPYNDTNVNEHLEIVFSLAKKYQKPIDLHQDFKDDYQNQSIEIVAKKTIAENFTGKMSVGHLTSLGAMPSTELEPIIQLLAEAQINVMCLPMTDLHLGGRNDDYNVRRAVTPVRKLRDGGVNVVLSTNNIRNPFTPYGNGDLIQVAMLAIPVCHLGGADDLHTVLPMITTNAAKACGFNEYGIEIGKPATFVLLNCTNYHNVIIDIPERLLVMKNGTITVRNGEIY